MAAVGLLTGCFGWNTHLPATPRRPQRREDVIVVGRSAARQTLLLLGRSGVPAGDPDEVGILFASHALSQELEFQLREVRSFTYAAAAGAWSGPHTGLIAGVSSVRNESAAEALREALLSVSRVRYAFDGAETHRWMRDAVLRSTVDWFGTVQDCAGSAAGLFLDGQAPDRYERLIERVRQSRPQEVRRAIYEYFDPSMMHAILGGSSRTCDANWRACGCPSKGGIACRRPAATARRAVNSPRNRRCADSIMCCLVSPARP